MTTVSLLAAGSAGCWCSPRASGRITPTRHTLELGAIRLAWRDRRIRGAYLGYFGHMWELFAMWAWVGVASAASYAATLDPAAAVSLGKLTAFVAIALGGLACVVAGVAADRIGKAEVTILAMAASGTAAVLTALTFGGPVWITFGWSSSGGSPSSRIRRNSPRWSPTRRRRTLPAACSPSRPRSASR